MDLNSALQKHSEWKTKFRMAIGSKSQMDAASIGRDNCCDLGKWLHGDGKSKLAALDSFKDCVSKHAQFHTEAGKVAGAINAARYAEAEAMINNGTPYANASAAVGGAIVRLKKEAAL